MFVPRWQDHYPPPGAIQCNVVWLNTVVHEPKWHDWSLMELEIPCTRYARCKVKPDDSIGPLWHRWSWTQNNDCHIIAMVEDLSKDRDRWQMMCATLCNETKCELDVQHYTLKGSPAWQDPPNCLSQPPVTPPIPSTPTNPPCQSYFLINGCM